jgi:hypothetical protein
MAALEEILERLNIDTRYRELGVFLALHHPPRCVKMWGREGGLENGKALVRLARGSVTAILHGHCHDTDLRWDGTDDSLPVMQAPSPALEPEEVPGRDDSVVLVRYSLHDGDLRSWDDVGEVELPLEPVIRERYRTFRADHAERFRSLKACTCGGPVAPEFACCPWCSEPNETSTSGLVCHDCDRPILPGWKYCPWPHCEGEFDSDGGRYDSGRMVATCECGEKVEAYHARCPSCGDEQAKPDDDHPDECDECGWPLDVDAYLFCPWCGEPQ